MVVVPLVDNWELRYKLKTFKSNGGDHQKKGDKYLKVSVHEGNVLAEKVDVPWSEAVPPRKVLWDERTGVAEFRGSSVAVSLPISLSLDSVLKVQEKESHEDVVRGQWAAKPSTSDQPAHWVARLLKLAQTIQSHRTRSRDKLLAELETLLDEVENVEISPSKQRELLEACRGLEDTDLLSRLLAAALFTDRNLILEIGAIVRDQEDPKLWCSFLGGLDLFCPEQIILSSLLCALKNGKLKDGWESVGEAAMRLPFTGEAMQMQLKKLSLEDAISLALHLISSLSRVPRSQKHHLPASFAKMLELMFLMLDAQGGRLLSEQEECLQELVDLLDLAEVTIRLLCDLETLVDLEPSSVDAPRPDYSLEFWDLE